MRSLPFPALALVLAGCLVNTELYEDLSDGLAVEEGDVDLDGDGWLSEQDCDDDDATVHPEADELCDGVDQDCDGQVDEDALDAATWYQDGDQDGWGGGQGLATCDQPSGWVAKGGDCHDDQATAFPGSTAPEFPGDGIDQDCDGLDGCSDLDCDGLPDLVIPSQNNDDGFASFSPIWFGTGETLGESPHQTLPSQGAIATVAEDFDRDGWMDLVLVGYHYGDSYDLDALIYWGSPDGLDAGRSGSVGTSAALDAAVADLDHDGFPDLILSSGNVDPGEATIHWGSVEGFLPGAATTLPTSGTFRILVSDLQGDGWEDLVFISHGSSRGFETRSSVYWNRGGHFLDDDFSSLPSTGAVDGVCVDLDLDGYQEIVVANHESEDSLELLVSIHHGSAEGYDDAAVTEIKAFGAIAVASADLDRDGWPDLVVAHNSSDSTSQVDSAVYWGSADGVTGAEATALPTGAAKDVAIADLDQDGWLDVIFANYYGLHGTSTESTVYWGSVDGFSSVGSTGLPTVGAQHVVARDMDQDGWLDLLFTQYTSGASYVIPSYLYYGSPGGFTAEHREDLLVDGPWGRALVLGAPAPDLRGGAR